RATDRRPKEIRQDARTENQQNTGVDRLSSDRKWPSFRPALCSYLDGSHLRRATVWGRRGQTPTSSTTNKLWWPAAPPDQTLEMVAVTSTVATE
ncbi:MAG TPA: hypothetical protein VMX74_10430, partial [Pirellulales bacterium]|nr:hypothetical protein [Pirellulales bacterium]